MMDSFSPRHRWVTFHCSSLLTPTCWTLTMMHCSWLSTTLICCRLIPNSEIEMGSARAARAVFRALAENPEGTEKFQTFGRMSCAKRLDARRVQRHPRRVCSPTSVFGLKREEFVSELEAEVLSARWRSFLQHLAAFAPRLKGRQAASRRRRSD